MEQVAAGLLDVVGGIFGATVTVEVQRSQDLRNRDAVTPEILEAAAPASAGDVQVQLRLSTELVEGEPVLRSGFAGGVPEGLVITIAGAEYSVTADARVDDPRQPEATLTLHITPPLAAPLSERDPVALAPAATWTITGCLQQEASQYRLGAELASRASYVLEMPHIAAPTGWAPDEGDLFQVQGEKAVAVYAIPAKSAGAWHCVVGPPGTLNR